jgi:hypothetical protein
MNPDTPRPLEIASDEQRAGRCLQPTPRRPLPATDAAPAARHHDLKGHPIMSFIFTRCGNWLNTRRLLHVKGDIATTQAGGTFRLAHDSVERWLQSALLVGAMADNDNDMF